MLFVLKVYFLTSKDSLPNFNLDSKFSDFKNKNGFNFMDHFV